MIETKEGNDKEPNKVLKRHSVVLKGPVEVYNGQGADNHVFTVISTLGGTLYGNNPYGIRDGVYNEVKLGLRLNNGKLRTTDVLSAV